VVATLGLSKVGPGTVIYSGQNLPWGNPGLRRHASRHWQEAIGSAVTVTGRGNGEGLGPRWPIAGTTGGFYRTGNASVN